MGAPAVNLPTVAPRVALVDDVYERIKAWIVDDVREGGVRANIDALARALDVSPTPVREALTRLDAEGFVDKEPSRGYTVAPPLSPSDVADLFAFRRMLEPWAAGRAAGRCDADGAGRLRDELARAGAPDGGDYEGYRALADHDERFHTLIFELAGNGHATAAFRRTHCHAHLFRLGYRAGMGEQAIAEHAAVVDAIVTGDISAAEAAMARHLERSADRIGAVVGH